MIDNRTLDLTRRGFFGAAAAAVVAACAPRRAYSFLTGNPVAQSYCAYSGIVPYGGTLTITIAGKSFDFEYGAGETSLIITDRIVARLKDAAPVPRIVPGIIGARDTRSGRFGR